MTGTTESVDLDGFLAGLTATTKEEFEKNPDVEDAGAQVDVGSLPIVKRKWIRIKDVVAVVADLKNSTKMGTGKGAASTASIYQAATGGVVNIFDKFEADFIQIQGDGAFGLFWGDLRYERAACSAVTIRTFSEDLTNKIAAKWPSTPETGFKVGIASGRVLVKRVGTPRNPAQQEPVWAGKPVNYAAKAAQGADHSQVVVTGSVWDEFEKNDYLAISCPCGNGPSLNIWQDTLIDRLPDGDPEAQGRTLVAAWCAIHGDSYCDMIMAGNRRRDDVNDLRKALQMSQMREAIRKKARAERTSLRAHITGLSE